MKKWHISGKTKNRKSKHKSIYHLYNKMAQKYTDLKLLFIKCYFQSLSMKTIISCDEMNINAMSMNLANVLMMRYNNL